MARTKSRINLTLEFHTTAETPRISAQEIVSRIAQFIAMDMDLAEVTAQVQSAFLSHIAAYEADRLAYDEAHSAGPIGMGDPKTDALN